MKSIKKVLCEKNIASGYLYFYIHFVVEIMCFYFLNNIIGDSIFLWIVPLVYDALAFVPQSLLGYVSDHYPKIKMGIIGVILLVIAYILFFNNIFNSIYISLIILCIGNALIHVNGAEVTLRSSEGKMSHSAIFVSGGSFGVVTGKLLAHSIPYYFIILLGLTMIPFIMLAEYYRKNTKNVCSKFNYARTDIKAGSVILLSVIVVIVRAYMGYGIPTSWNKTTTETILLFSFMGFGKALGGILIDLIGMRKTALISVIFALPFLVFGDKIMVVSLFGVMMFSMTMAVTLGLLVSKLKNSPGLAFGLTTIGLFLGTVPIFFIKFTTVLSNAIVITMLTVVCVIILLNIIKKEDNNA